MYYVYKYFVTTCFGGIDYRQVIKTAKKYQEAEVPF